MVPGCLSIKNHLFSIVFAYRKALEICRFYDSLASFGGANYELHCDKLVEAFTNAPFTDFQSRRYVSVRTKKMLKRGD